MNSPSEKKKAKRSEASAPGKSSKCDKDVSPEDTKDISPKDKQDMSPKDGKDVQTSKNASGKEAAPVELKGRAELKQLRGCGLLLLLHVLYVSDCSLPVYMYVWVLCD